MPKVIIKDVHTLQPRNVEVGEYTYGHEGIRLYNSHDAKLFIGKFCSIAWNLQIFLGGKHRTNFVTTYPFGYIHKEKFTNFPEICVKQGKEFGTTNGDIVIGNDVFIGANVTILSGVKIGDGAVISANSTVFESVKPYSIVGGNPSKFWMFRFSNEKIEKLLKMQWWNWNEKNINEALPLLCSSNIDDLIKYYDNNFHL